MNDKDIMKQIYCTGNRCKNAIDQIKLNGRTQIGDKYEYVLYLNKDFRIADETEEPIAYTIRRRVPCEWMREHETALGRFEYESFPLSPFARICASMTKEMHRMQMEMIGLGKRIF